MRGTSLGQDPIAPQRVILGAQPPASSAGAVLRDAVGLSTREHAGVQYLKLDPEATAIAFLSYYEVSAASVTVEGVPPDTMVLIDPGGPPEIKGEQRFTSWMTAMIATPPSGKGAAIGLLITPTDSYVLAATSIDQIATMQEMYGSDNVIVIKEPINGWGAAPAAADRTMLYAGIGAAVIGGIALAYLLAKG